MCVLDWQFIDGRGRPSVLFESGHRQLTTSNPDNPSRFHGQYQHPDNYLDDNGRPYNYHDVDGNPFRWSQ